jgi:hypothetical protein
MTMYKPRTDPSSATLAAPMAAAAGSAGSAAPCNCGPAAPAGPGGGSTPATGVVLTPSLEELIYFNGRFLKAEDFQTEQNNYLLRIALSERAQGAGVSYGFHVTATTGPMSTTFVDQITQNFMAKVLASEASRKAWSEIVGKDRKPAEVAAVLSAAVEEICKADPGHSDTSLVIGRGHAADGWGSDLYLKCTTTVKLAGLIDAFGKYPTTCSVPGPSITPIADPQGVGLTGAYLLCLYVNGLDFGKVPVYGVQCGDNAQQVCSLGYHSEGVALQLVYFPGVTAPSKGTDPFAWRGEGARRYFDAEIAAHGTRLPLLGKGLPFSGEADAPDCGSHVPIGVVYLSGGDFVAYDEWTAKRLRTPAEMAYWLGGLLQPSKPAQLARVVQFQSQLTEALAAAGAAKSGTTLWDLGFATGDKSPILELPGVGFLPIALVSGTAASSATHIAPAELADGVNGLFDGVPYRLMPATPGEMNAIFGDALDSGPLKLTRKAPLGIGDPRDRLALIEELLIKAAEAGLGKGHGGAKLPEEEVPGIGSDVVGFIGESPIGPTNVATRIESLEEFTKTFGDSGHAPILAPSVSGFFANGGSHALVVNVGLNAGKDSYAKAVAQLGNVSLIVAPGQTSPEIQDVLLKACETSKRCFALLDSPEAVSGVDKLTLPRASQWGVFLYPWLQVPDPVKGNIFIPPSGFVAGAYVRSVHDNQRPPINELLKGALAVRFPVSKLEQAAAAVKRINLIQSTSTGVRVSGAYTIEPNPNAISAGELEQLLEDDCMGTLGRIAGLVDKAKVTPGEPQAFVWYPEKRADYQGYVMFTWPIAQLGGCITTPEAHLTIGIEMTVMRPPRQVKTDATGKNVVLARNLDKEAAPASPAPVAAPAAPAAPAGVHAAPAAPSTGPAPTSSASREGLPTPRGHVHQQQQQQMQTAPPPPTPPPAPPATGGDGTNRGLTSYELVPAHSVLNGKLVVFRDSEWAGPTQLLADINLENFPPDLKIGDLTPRTIALTSLRISIDPPVCDLDIKYEGRALNGKALEARGEVDGKWLRAAKGFASLRIGLTGAAKDKYDVRYMARYRGLFNAAETRWCENFEEVSLASVPWVEIGLEASVAQVLGPYLPIEAIYVKVIPKGTPAPSLTKFAAVWTKAKPTQGTTVAILDEKKPG